MTVILLYIAAGLLLAACLLRLVLKGSGDDGSELNAPHDFWSASGSVAHFAERIFGNEDWEYVQSFGSKTLSRKFLKERKALALSWLRSARSEARALMRVHRTASRTSPNLKLSVEFRIQYAYVGFLFYCALLGLAIRARGPVALQGFAALADARSVRLYEIVGQVFPLVQPGEDEFGHATGDG